ncbi:MAG: beta-N-acetylhexosaminidase [Oceanipulchritudo sp.]
MSLYPLYPPPHHLRQVSGSRVDPGLEAETCHQPELPSQAYRLVIRTGSIRLHASDTAGFRHARLTLEQIRRHWPVLHELDIEDHPDLQRRGFMLDISRCRIPTLAQFEELINLLASLKYNELQLYMEHPFAYPGHELVWGASSPLTPSEVRHLDGYCRSRGIELVPNQNSFGHMERWLKYPQYHYLAECPRGFRHPLDPTRGWVPGGSTLKPGRAALDFIASLYEHLLPCFSSSLLHAGCDETWELGQGASRDRIARLGKERVYLDFVLGIQAIAARSGHRMMFWADMLQDHPRYLSEIPASCIPVLWGYEQSHPFHEYCPRIARAGLDFHVAPGTSDWDSYSGRLDNALGNIRSAIQCGAQHRARGSLLVSWGDRGHQQAWPLVLPGIVEAGCRSWNTGTGIDLETALARSAFPSESSRLAEAVIRLGRIENGWIPEDRNHSFNRWLLRANPLAVRMDLDLLDRKQLQAGLNEARALSEYVCNGYSPEDRSLPAREIDLAARFCALAYQRGLALLNGNSQQALCPEFQSLIGTFESLWLRRFRPGGLCESSDHLRRALRSMLNN